MNDKRGQQTGRRQHKACAASRLSPKEAACPALSQGREKPEAKAGAAAARLAPRSARGALGWLDGSSRCSPLAAAAARRQAVLHSTELHSDGGVPWPHALLLPALPVQVRVEHALPAVVCGHRLALDPRARRLSSQRLAPLCRLVAAGQNIVTAARGGSGAWEPDSSGSSNDKFVLS